MDARSLAAAVAFIPAGGAVGWAYFSLMRRSLGYLGSGKGGARWFIALILLRLGLFAGGVVAALYLGGLCLVGYMAGFILARTLAVRAAKNETPRPSAAPREENKVHD